MKRVPTESESESRRAAPAPEAGASPPEVAGADHGSAQAGSESGCSPRRTGRPQAREHPDSGSDSDSELLSRSLLAHYDAHRRDLPWRRDTDPYRVWVSEVMLQQTRVETVVPYYRRWLDRFPDVARLADAPADDVLKHWEGLGYYTRARNLHRAARLVRERYGGELPSDPEALRALPGFGEYTAGAVASIAFGRKLPAVDGNVRRVLARVCDVAAPTAAWLRRTATALVPADRPGDYNQALMELGATVCLPRSPRCDACPLAPLCLARARGTVTDRPARKRRSPVPTVALATAVVGDDGGRLLLVRFPEGGLLAGLWGFPADEPTAGEAPPAAAARAARAAGVTVSAAGALELGAVRHQFSHLTATYRAFRFLALRPFVALPADARWVTVAELAELALPVAQRKIARLAMDSGR